MNWGGPKGILNEKDHPTSRLLRKTMCPALISDNLHEIKSGGPVLVLHFMGHWEGAPYCVGKGLCR